MASVVGDPFSTPLVVRAAALSETVVLDALDELVSAALVQAAGEELFRFDHALTLEVAYRDMGPARLRALHRQVAQTLAESGEDLDGRIAYHYERGNALDRAVPFAFRAGQQAAALAAWTEAIAFYEQALRGHPDDETHLAIYQALGEARFHRGDFAGSTENYRTALALATRLGDLSAMEANYIFLNQSLLPQGRTDEAAALGEALAASGPPELAVCAYFMWGTGLGVGSARPLEAEQHLRRAEHLLNDQPSTYRSRVTHAQIMYQLAGVFSQQGRIAEAIDYYLEAEREVKADSAALDRLRHVMLYNNLAYNLHLLNDPRARNYARTGIAVAQERGSLSHLPYLLSTSGEIAMAAEQFDEAQSFFEEGLRIAEQIPIPERIAGMTLNLGLVTARRGQHDLARERFREAMARADALTASHLAVRARLGLAALLPEAEARLLLSEARTIAEASGYGRLLNEIDSAELPALTLRCRFNTI